MSSILASQRPYKMFEYQWPELPLTSTRTCFMVSTLSIPQRPVALCGPDEAFARALCAVLNNQTDRPETLEAALGEAIKAIASLPEDALGYVDPGTGEPPWPCRDELLHNLREAAK